MPGSLVSSLLSFFASHLILLTFAGFVVVGVHLAGLWGDGLPMIDWPRESAVPPSNRPDPAPRTVPEPDVPPQRAREKDEPDRASGETSAPTRPASRQPVLIGGTLPNYSGTSEGRFRPPRGGPAALSLLPSREQLVQQARRAFWNGDLEKAESIYVAALTRFPDDADTFGELGNLYRSMGKRQRALDAYFEAGLRLKATGQTEKLKDVIDLLQSQDYEATDRLRP